MSQVEFQMYPKLLLSLLQKYSYVGTYVGIHGSGLFNLTILTLIKNPSQPCVCIHCLGFVIPTSSIIFSFVFIILYIQELLTRRMEKQVSINNYAVGFQIYIKKSSSLIFGCDHKAIIITFAVA